VQPAVLPQVAHAAYELLDSGSGEKLERFGEVLLRRPDPQALWRRHLDEEAWDSAHLRFERESDRGGSWRVGPGAPRACRGQQPSWTINLGGARFHVRPTPFKHVGVFPEQASNWAYVSAAKARLRNPEPRLLNLFGYTGVASVLAAKDGWRVTHVDASKASIAWTLDNAEASGLGRKALRLICDDALAFARREVRRGSKYEGILLDPPHYGRGPKGEVWRLEEGLAPLLETARELLAPEALLVLSTYAVGYSPLAFANLLDEFGPGEREVGELALAESGTHKRLLPAGFCARWQRGIDR
jgi:23S rRNA (cytosine1962-C5)-methyltransferase